MSSVGPLIEPVLLRKNTAGGSSPKPDWRAWLRWFTAWATIRQGVVTGDSNDKRSTGTPGPWPRRPPGRRPGPR